MVADPERVSTLVHMNDNSLPLSKEEGLLPLKNNVVWPFRFFLPNALHRRAFERKVKERFPLEVTKAIKRGARLTKQEMDVIERIAETDWSVESLNMAKPEDIELAAQAVSLGAVICRGFSNFYSVDAHPCFTSVVHVNRSKGRPDSQVGSVTTVRDRIETIFDWTQSPPEIDKEVAVSLMDDFYKMGPFGFRGPASAIIPDHLTQLDLDKKTTQIIAAGYDCPSNSLIERVLQLTGEDFIFITSANISHNVKGTTEEPAHFKMVGIQADFGHKRGFMMVSHEDEEATEARYYPMYRPMSTSILALHKVTYDGSGQPLLFLERHGSLHYDEILKVVSKYGFGLEKGLRAQSRLPQRHYPN